MQSYEADGDMLQERPDQCSSGWVRTPIREANQKAEEILHRANLRGDDIIRDANELLQKASDRADRDRERGKREKAWPRSGSMTASVCRVTRFKSDVLNLYRSHVESLEPSAGVPEVGSPHRTLRTRMQSEELPESSRR